MEGWEGEGGLVDVAQWEVEGCLVNRYDSVVHRVKDIHLKCRRAASISSNSASLRWYSQSSRFSTSFPSQTSGESSFCGNPSGRVVGRLSVSLRRRVRALYFSYSG